MDKVMNQIRKEAAALGNRTQDFQPRRPFRGILPPLPARGTIRQLLIGIPENHTYFLRNREFLRTVRDAARQTQQVVIRVVPVRGWRR